MSDFKIGDKIVNIVSSYNLTKDLLEVYDNCFKDGV